MNNIGCYIIEHQDLKDYLRRVDDRYRQLLDMPNNWADGNEIAPSEEVLFRGFEWFKSVVIEYHYIKKKLPSMPGFNAYGNGTLDIEFSSPKELLVNVPSNNQHSLAFYGDSPQRVEDTKIKGKIDTYKSSVWLLFWLNDEESFLDY